MSVESDGATTGTMPSDLRHLLRVNLTERTTETEEISEEYRNKFISGKGLGAAMLLRELEPGTDPLSPENRMIFTFGPLTGHAPGTSRYGVVTKSPLTGAFVDSYSGGHFPSMFRFALPTYLGVVFEGKADEPVMLRVTDDGVTIEDADHLWGSHDARETAEAFPDRDTKVAAIGPAGEHQVKFATISSDEASHHAGRGGVGAVMGSKNLKAVVASGTKPDDSGLQDLRIQHTQRLGSSDEVRWARTGGTQLIVDWTQEVGALPSHNWTKGSIPNVDELNIGAFEPGHQRPDSCYNCPVACGHVTDFSETDVDGAFPDASVAWGPEYETIGMMGANTDITDVTGVTELADRADRLGMDTISLGNVVSWLMEVSEAGLVDFDIAFGDAETAADVVDKVAHREGIGDALAEGAAGAAEQLCDGHSDAREAAVEVKGMELPAYDPRASFSMALAYATADRGGCHQRAFPIGSDAMGKEREPYDTEGHAEAVVEEQDENALSYSMVACNFTAYSYERVAEWLTEFGYDVGVEDLETVGERAWTMTRLFNLREGFGREDDSLPERLKRPLESGGPADGNYLTDEAFGEMLDEYYELRGWTDEGVPETETLERLGVESFAPDMVRREG